MEWLEEQRQEYSKVFWCRAGQHNGHCDNLRVPMHSSGGQLTATQLMLATCWLQSAKQVLVSPTHHWAGWDTGQHFGDLCPLCETRVELAESPNSGAPPNQKLDSPAVWGSTELGSIVMLRELP